MNIQVKVNKNHVKAVLVAAQLLRRFNISNEGRAIFSQLINKVDQLNIFPDGTMEITVPDSRLLMDEEKLMLYALTRSRKDFFDLAREIRRKPAYSSPVMQDQIRTTILKIAHFSKIIKYPDSQQFMDMTMNWYQRFLNPDSKLSIGFVSSSEFYNYMIVDDISYIRWKLLPNSEIEIKARSHYPAHCAIYGELAKLLMLAMDIKLPYFLTTGDPVARAKQKYRCVPVCKSWDSRPRLVVRMLLSPDPSRRWINPPVRVTGTRNYFTLAHLISDYFYGTAYVDKLLLTQELTCQEPSNQAGTF